MNIILVYLGVFVAILLIALALKLIKGVIKIMFFVSFVLFIFLFVTGYFVIQDAKEFKEKFPTEETVYLMTYEDDVIAGFSIEGLDPEGAGFFSDEEINNYVVQYNEKDFDINDTYKIFIVDYDAFNETLNEGISYEGVSIDSELAEELFTSDDSVTVLAKEIDEENWLQARDKLIDDLGYDSEVKSAVFAVLITNGFKQPADFILKNIKTGELEVYPESAMFTVIKYVPESIYNKIMPEDNETEILGEG